MATNPAEQHNIIGQSTTVEGTLRSSGNVSISGTVNGNVEVDGRTMVMPGGVVEGEVASTTAEVGGTVKGRVLVRERLVLKASAVIDGDIRTDKLVIEEGATFNGKCEMGGTAGRSAAPRREAQSGASGGGASGGAGSGAAKGGDSGGGDRTADRRAAASSDG